MKIYTKTGDGGQTGLFGGSRVRKNDVRIEAIGAVDELNAVLGLVRTEALPIEIDSRLASVQHTLFDLGAELAALDPRSCGTNLVSSEQIKKLESAIDQFQADLPPLQDFILPGGCRAAALLHVARSVCRRAERCAVSLGEQENVVLSPNIIAYLNRLGDLLFVLARAANQLAGRGDVLWQKVDR
ncbi:MAG: cob(I)yrinic acid a,c-diamide adenosyltransferase [Pirellulales bacterium]|nr:cob(I)yrinic acid a,c-diamide adenosyltransferase [Pirellulales bacterium]